MQAIEKNNQENQIPSDYGNTQGRKASFSITSAPPFYLVSNSDHKINAGDSKENSKQDESKKSHSFLTIGRKAPFSITSAPPFYRFFFKAKQVCELFGRRTFVVTGIITYWFIIMKYLVGYFEIGLFMFIVGLSLIFSTLFKSWGLLEWGLKS